LRVESAKGEHGAVAEIDHPHYFWIGSGIEAFINRQVALAGDA
jgi:hypothetical protein